MTIQMIYIPSGDGKVIMECSACGPLGVTLERQARTVLFKHLASEHPVGAPL